MHEQNIFCKQTLVWSLIGLSQIFSYVRKSSYSLLWFTGNSCSIMKLWLLCQKTVSVPQEDLWSGRAKWKYSFRVLPWSNRAFAVAALHPDWVCWWSCWLLLVCSGCEVNENWMMLMLESLVSRQREERGDGVALLWTTCVIIRCKIAPPSGDWFKLIIVENQMKAFHSTKGS